MNTYTVEEVETAGIECVFYSEGARRQGWAMPNGDLVIYAGYAQVILAPDTCYTLNPEALRLCRKAVANKLLSSDKRLGEVVSNDEWIFGSKALCTIARFDSDGVEEEVAVAVSFHTDSARPVQIIKSQLKLDVSTPAFKALTVTQKNGVTRVLNVFDRQGNNPRIKECRDTSGWIDLDCPSQAITNWEGLDRPTQGQYATFEQALEGAYVRVALSAIE